MRVTTRGGLLASVSFDDQHGGGFMQVYPMESPVSATCLIDSSVNRRKRGDSLPIERLARV